MSRNYHSLSGFWYARDVPWPVGKLVFKSMVYNVGLSGLEAEFGPDYTQGIIRLETALHVLQRKVLGHRLSTVTLAGEHRRCTVAAMRAEFDTASVYSEQRHRRIKWWQSIVTHPDDNVQLRAALFGAMGAGRAF